MSTPLTNLQGKVNFKGPEWLAIKDFLKREREAKITRLIATRQDDDDILRGAIGMIDRILLEEGKTPSGL
jgi:hypothetical protein